MSVHLLPVTAMMIEQVVAILLVPSRVHAIWDIKEMEQLTTAVRRYVVDYVAGTRFVKSCIDCMDGDVLLMDGNMTSASQREGRVEICYGNEYHAICDDLWNVNDAQVVCRQLNISGTSKLFPADTL